MAITVGTTGTTHSHRPVGRTGLSTTLVILITLAALAVGFFLRNSVVTATKSYTTPYRATVSYPDGWRVDAADANNRVTFSDPGSGRFATMLELSSVLVSASATDTETLGTVSQSVSTSRGSDLTAYRVLSIDGNSKGKGFPTVKGLPAIKTTYAFVSTSNNAFSNSLPTTVIGRDYLVRKGDRVYIFTVQSTEANQDDASADFDRFVDSAQLP